MEKKWNKWLIILGIILTGVLLFTPIGLLLAMNLPFGKLIMGTLTLVAPFCIIFGAINYLNWKTWVKVVVSGVLFVIIISVILLLLSGIASLI